MEAVDRMSDGMKCSPLDNTPEAPAALVQLKPPPGNEWVPSRFGARIEARGYPLVAGWGFELDQSCGRLWSVVQRRTLHPVAHAVNCFHGSSQSLDRPRSLRFEGPRTAGHRYPLVPATPSLATCARIPVLALDDEAHEVAPPSAGRDDKTAGGGRTPSVQAANEP